MRFKLDGKNLLKKIEQTLSETRIVKRQFYLTGGVWPYVVFGPDAAGNTVVREGRAEQALIQKVPVYIATVGGRNHPDQEGVPIEDIAGSDIPRELEGLKVLHLAPMRPLEVSVKKTVPGAGADVESELTEFYKGNDTALIHTPDEAYWALSVLRYLEETDRVFPTPVVADFNSRLGNITGPHYSN